MSTEAAMKTANEFTDIKDVRDIFLYTKSGYIFCYVQVPYFSLDLLPDAEREAKTRNMASSSKSDRKMFVYQTFPREIDLDDYKNDLRERYRNELSSPGMRFILAEKIKEAVELSTGGDNYEHQHYIKIWEKVGYDRFETEKALRQRAEEFKVRYQSVGINAEILKEQAILKMCNLFGNTIQAPYDNMENYLYETSLKILKG